MATNVGKARFDLRRWSRVGAGTLVWIALPLSVWHVIPWALDAERSRSDGRTLAAAVRFHFQRPRDITVRLSRPVTVELGAAIYLAEDAEGHAHGSSPVGEIGALLDPAGRPLPALYGQVSALRVRLYDGHRTSLQSDATARLILIPQTFDWVVRTLLTDEATIKIAEEWNRTLLLHRQDFFVLLTPVARNLLRDVEQYIASRLKPFGARHAGRVKALVERLEAEAGGERFTALFQSEIWPLTEDKLRPVMSRIGDRVWERLPLWSLGWKLAYEKLPFTREGHFEEAWSEFVDHEVVPILQAETPALIGAVREVAREAFANPRLKDHAKGAFERLLESPEFESLAQDFVKEAFLDSGEFHALLRKHWSSAPVQEAVTRAAGYLEPMLRRMGDAVFGTRESGITDEFARVLRSQILLKDREKILLYPGTATDPLPSGAELEAPVEWELRR